MSARRQHELRLHRERTRDRHALLLAAGKLVRPGAVALAHLVETLAALAIADERAVDVQAPGIDSR
jgi:hypothetical protein